MELMQGTEKFPSERERVYVYSLKQFKMLFVSQTVQMAFVDDDK